MQSISLSLRRFAPGSRLFSIGRGAIAKEPVFYRHRVIDSGVQYATISFSRLTRDPVWLIANRLNRAHRTASLSLALAKSSVSEEEYDQWKPAALAYDMEVAMLQLKKMGFALKDYAYFSSQDPGAVSPKSQLYLPAWLLIHLVGTKAKSAEQARTVLSLVLFHLPIMPDHLQPSLLVLAAHTLAKHGVLAPMSTLITRFLELPFQIKRPQLYYNLLLHAISRFPSSVTSSRLAITVLEAMNARQVSLSGETFRRLLYNRQLIVELSKYLQTRGIVRANTPPKLADLEFRLKMFAKEGLVHDASAYLQAVREILDEQGRRGEAPYGVKPGIHPGSVTKHNTWYLQSFRDDRFSAFKYLIRLVHAETRQKTRDEMKQQMLIHVLRSTRSRPLRPVIDAKRQLDIRDWTTALSIMARNRWTKYSRIMSFFRSLRSNPSPNLRPTIATYTATIRGLLAAHRTKAALKLWKALIKSPEFRLDRPAMDVGVRVLGRSGMRYQAFDLIERCYQKRRQSRVKSGRRLKPPAPNTGTVNSFMTVLNQKMRPDVVFALWDHMQVLYRVQPDLISLNLVLEAALVAFRLNDTIPGILAQMQRSNPFRRRKDKGSPESSPALEREFVVNVIEEMLGGKGNRRRIVHTLWRQRPAWYMARDMFKQIILGNWPELAKVQPPAHAIRTSTDALLLSPLSDLAHNLMNSGSPVESQQKSQNSIPPPGTQDHSPPVQLIYPNICPEDTAFRWYIQLCGHCSFTQDIPLALAWMKELKIEPHRKTLSLALAFWADVSVDAPLIERFRGGSREYSNLELWITEWVGREKTPRPSDIVGALKDIKERKTLPYTGKA